MKKVYATAIFVGLSGTAFIGSVYAQVAEGKLPPKLQSLIEQVRSGKVKDVPPFPDIKSFVDSSNTQIQALQTQLNAILNEKGYLIGTQQAVDAQNRLTEAKKNIAALRAVESLSQPLAVDRAVVPLDIDILNQLPPPETFPGACYSYQGNELTGIIQYFNRQWRFQYGPNDYKSFLSEINDVGLVKSGKEYPITGRTPNGMAQKAWLGTDPVTGKEVVVCLSHPYKVSTPVVPSKKPKAPAKGVQKL